MVIALICLFIVILLIVAATYHDKLDDAEAAYEQLRDDTYNALYERVEMDNAMLHSMKRLITEAGAASGPRSSKPTVRQKE